MKEFEVRLRRQIAQECRIYILAKNKDDAEDELSEHLDDYLDGTEEWEDVDSRNTDIGIEDIQYSGPWEEPDESPDD